MNWTRHHLVASAFLLPCISYISLQESFWSLCSYVQRTRVFEGFSDITLFLLGASKKPQKVSVNDSRIFTVSFIFFLARNSICHGQKKTFYNN